MRPAPSILLPDNLINNDLKNVDEIINQIKEKHSKRQLSILTSNDDTNKIFLF